MAIGVEDPGSSRLWQAARTAGLELVGLPVDDDGLVVDELEKHPGLRAVCVGAARQVATGCVLAPHRRSALLDWARRVDGLVVEDDFDSEFSYGGPAPAVMQGTDRQRVALLGSVNRTLNPTVGIGWVVAPRRWVEAVRADREIPVSPPALNQLALALLHGVGGLRPASSRVPPPVPGPPWRTGRSPAGQLPATGCAGRTPGWICCSNCPRLRRRRDRRRRPAPGHVAVQPG